MTVKMPTLRLRRCFISGSDFKNSYYNHAPRSTEVKEWSYKKEPNWNFMTEKYNTEKSEKNH